MLETLRAKQLKIWADKHEIKLRPRESCNKNEQVTRFLTPDFCNLASDLHPEDAINRIIKFLCDYFGEDKDVVFRRLLMLVDHYIDEKELRRARKRKTAKEILSALVESLPEEELIQAMFKQDISKIDLLKITEPKVNREPNK